MIVQINFIRGYELWFKLYQSKDNENSDNSRIIVITMIIIKKKPLSNKCFTWHKSGSSHRIISIRDPDVGHYEITSKQTEQTEA